MDNMSKNKYASIPNMITSFRVLGTFGLFFVEPFTLPFFILYTFCGVSDVLDGWVARTTGSITEFGSRFDSISDLLFYAVMLIRIFPAMWEILPKTIWLGVAAVIILRIISYTLAALKYRRFASLHTYMNKLTGFFMFCVPYFLTSMYGVVYCKCVCMVSAISTLEELLIHCCAKKYTTENKTLWKILQHQKAA